jgi:polysaccharide export outer membrane protein
MKTAFLAAMGWLAVVGFAPLAAAQGVPAGSSAPPAAAVVDDAVSQDYILGTADVVEVSVLGRPDFTTRGRIDEDGTIRLPYLGAVAAANKTIRRLADDVGAALDSGGYFSHPIVKVDVVSFASRYVTVLGNVQSPGLVTVDRAYRLSEIIARVGGLKEGAADYIVFRPRRGEDRHISIEALATGDLNDDPYVSPGDKIYSPDAAQFYVSGEVKAPGEFPLRGGMTFRMAIARGGGVTDAGSINSLSVTRGGHKLPRVDLDGKVLAGDVIVVGERLF